MLRGGERIGDWIVEAPLGEGGMGAVYRVHSALSRRVMAALKVMKPTSEPDARARFVREAEALAALRHPAIVRVMGFTEDAERDLLYLVMELVPGETLRARLQRGPMSLPEALATFVPLAQGLDHAHSRGIFHRDLKPANVVLSPDGTPRLVDFGIAAAQEAEPLTTTGHLGTLPYLPPEVFRGERAEPVGIDVYAFGLLLHEALTGERPFALEPGATPAVAAAAVAGRKLQATSFELPAQFSERLRELVRRATDPDPRVRPSMREIRQTLESLVERRAAATSSGRMVAVPTVPAATAATEEATTWVPDPTPSGTSATTASGAPTTGAGRLGRRRHDRVRGRLLTVAGIAAAGLAVAVVLMARQPDAEPVKASAPSQAAGPRTRPAPRPSSRAGVTRPAVPPSPPPQGSAVAPGGDESGRPSIPAPTPEREAAPEQPVDDVTGGPSTAPDGETPVRLSGRWDILHEVESTSYGPFAGMTLGYRVALVQEGDRVWGRGYKVSENGLPLPPARRTPIEVTGSIDGDHVVLHFTEMGRTRTSRGVVRWRLGPGGTLQGHFASDAADSSGPSVARRLP